MKRLRGVTTGVQITVSDLKAERLLAGCSHVATESYELADDIEQPEPDRPKDQSKRPKGHTSIAGAITAATGDPRIGGPSDDRAAARRQPDSFLGKGGHDERAQK